MLPTKYVCVLVVAIGILQCGATQFSAASYTEADGRLAHYIFFMIYLTLYSNSILLPIYKIMVKRDENNKTKLKQQQEQQSLLMSSGGEEEVQQLDSGLSSPVEEKNKPADQEVTSNNNNNNNYSSIQLTLIVSFLYFCYIGANGCYNLALSTHMRPSITASIFAVCPVFVVFLSWIVLNIKPRLIHWAALVTGVTGVIIAIQPWHAASIFDDSKNKSNNKNNGGDDDEPHPMFAIICAILAPLFAATYKVMFSKFFNNSKWYEAGRILGLLSVANLLWGSVLISIIIWGTNLEFNPFKETLVESHPVINLNQTMPSATTTTTEVISLSTIPSFIWALVCGSIAIGLLFNLTVNWSVTQFAPLYASVGTVISTLMNTFFDAILGKGWPDTIAWCGMFLIVVSFMCVASASSSDDKDTITSTLLLARDEVDDDETEDHQTVHQDYTSDDDRRSLV